MLVSQKIAIAAHLHVMLRRKTGRVTDTEWMAGNLEYALEIIRFSRAKALEDGHAELTEWADKLERAVLAQPPVSKPVVQSALQMLRERNVPAPVTRAPAVADRESSGFAASVFGDTGGLESGFGPDKPAQPRDPNVPRYVGGIR